MSAPARLRIAAGFATLSIVLGVVTASAMFDAGADRLPAALLAIAGHAAAAVAVALLLRDTAPELRRMPWLFLSAALTAAVSLQVFGAAYAASWDAADTGIPSPEITRLGLPALVLALLGLGAAIAAVLATFGRGPAGIASIRRPIVFGVLLAIPGLVILVNPLHSLLLPIGVSIALLMRLWRAAPRPAKPDADSRSTVLLPGPSAARLVRPLAAIALGIVALVWAAGIWVGMAATGTELATRAMGVSAAVAQFAAVPLFLAAAAILRSTGRARIATSPVALSLASGGLLAGATIAAVGYASEGGALYLGAATSGASLGLWLAVAVTRVLPGLVERILIGIGIVVGGAVTWFALVPLTGGFALAVLAGIVLGVGPTPFSALSRVRAAASP